jgi:hypothetical protein
MSGLFVVMFILWHYKLTLLVCVPYSGPSIPVILISLRAYLAAFYGQEAKLNGDNASHCFTDFSHCKLNYISQIFNSTNYKTYKCIVKRVLTPVLVTKLNEVCNFV